MDGSMHRALTISALGSRLSVAAVGSHSVGTYADGPAIGGGVDDESDGVVGIGDGDGDDIEVKGLGVSNGMHPQVSSMPKNASNAPVSSGLSSVAETASTSFCACLYCLR